MKDPIKLKMIILMKYSAFPGGKRGARIDPESNDRLPPHQVPTPL